MVARLPNAAIAFPDKPEDRWACVFMMVNCRRQWHKSLSPYLTMDFTSCVYSSSLNGDYTVNFIQMSKDPYCGTGKSAWCAAKRADAILCMKVCTIKPAAHCHGSFGIPLDIITTHNRKLASGDYFKTYHNFLTFRDFWLLQNKPSPAL